MKLYSIHPPTHPPTHPPARVDPRSTTVGKYAHRIRSAYYLNCLLLWWRYEQHRRHCVEAIILSPWRSTAPSQCPTGRFGAYLTTHPRLTTPPIRPLVHPPTDPPAFTPAEYQAVLERELTGEDGRTPAYGGEGKTRRFPETQHPSPSLILNPYFLSSWGKKKVLGRRVEEGEGLGPRKELFELAARQLSARWRAQPSSSTTR